MSSDPASANANLPKFICVGAQRAGTTWLHECLKDHPDICMPKVKELHFFDRHYEEGLQSYGQNFTDELIGSAQTWGEITPNYYQEPNALERIKQDIPKVKIIYVIREPVSRAFSQYQLYALTLYKGLSFEEVIQSKPTVTDLSMQGKHLERIYELFDKEDVLVLFYDDIEKDPRTLIKRVYTFLGVNPGYVPGPINTRVNRVVLPGLQSWLTKLKLGWFIELVKRSPFSELIKSAFHKKSKPSSGTAKPTLSADTFADDIRKIEALTQVNLKHWR